MSDLSRSGGRVVPMRLKERFLVVVRGRERLDDWVELEEAFEQTEAFFGLGAEAVTIEQHPGWRAMPDLGLSGLWPGPAPSFPSLAPESSNEHDHYFRCPNCKNLFVVGVWLRDGNMIECDVSGCFGQFYAALDADRGAEAQHTPRGRSAT